MCQELEAAAISKINTDEILPTIMKLRPLDEKTVSQLMDSIRSNGLLQPVAVKAVGENSIGWCSGPTDLKP